MLVVSSPLNFSRHGDVGSVGESESECAGRTRVANLRATRLALVGYKSFIITDHERAHLPCLTTGAAQYSIIWWRSTSNIGAKVEGVLEGRICQSLSFVYGPEKVGMDTPTLPCFRVLFFVAVPGGSFNQFHEPTHA